MGFFDAKTLPVSQGKESFFGSYNIPTNVPAPEPKQSTLSKAGDIVKTVAKDLYSTAATIPVRAIQAEELLRTSFFGGPDSQKKAQEFATTPTNIGFGAQVQPLDTSSIGRAAQQTVGDIIKTASLTNIGGELTLAKQLALQGGAYGLGNALSEGKSIKNTAIDTAVGAAGGAVLGKGLSVAGKFFKEVPAEIPTKVEPSVTTQTINVSPTTKSEVITYPRPKVESVTKTEPVVTPTTISPEVKMAAEDTFRATTPDVYVPGNEKGWIEAASSDIQFAKDVVAGRANPALGVPKNAYFSVLKNLAEETGDIALIDELKLANPARTSASVGAQELRATQITGKDNIVDVLYKIETDRYSQLSKNMQKLVDQEGNNASRKILEDVRNFKPTNDIINKITDILTCK